MSLKLMYITNKPEIAQIAERAGVDQIFVDMEFIGKDKRQGGMDTVQNHHTIEDISILKDVLMDADVMVRINPIHEAYSNYMDSRDEVDASIKAGADILMLPYFTTPEEVQSFIEYVDGRVMTLLLVESLKAVQRLDEILKIPGIDQIHVGLNDLSLDLGKKFMFEILADGTVDKICEKIKKYQLPFGIGGFGRIGHGQVPAECIIKEHYRLGSTFAILSRSFCNVGKLDDVSEIKKIFEAEVRDIRNYENTCVDGYDENHRKLVEIVRGIVG